MIGGGVGERLIGKKGVERRSRCKEMGGGVRWIDGREKFEMIE